MNLDGSNYNSRLPIEVHFCSDEELGNCLCVMKDENIAPDVDFGDLSRKLEGYSGDDIMNICRDAAFNGMRRETAGRSLDELRKLQTSELQLPVLKEDFYQAIEKISPSVSQSDLKNQHKWLKAYGSL